MSLSAGPPKRIWHRRSKPRKSRASPEEPAKEEAVEKAGEEEEESTYWYGHRHNIVFVNHRRKQYKELSPMGDSLTEFLGDWELADSIVMWNAQDLQREK